MRGVNLLVLLTLILGITIFYSCGDILGPEDLQGLKGKITDNNGKPLSGVKVFCVFTEPEPLSKIQKLIPFTPGSTDFKLYQNLPNPFSNITYLRFSLPLECKVELSISSVKNNRVVWTYEETLSPGIYQKALENIAGNLALKNGIYRLIMKASLNNSLLFTDEIQILLTGSAGKPNSVSDMNGRYTFDYNDAFIGDSISVNSFYSGGTTMQLITGTVNLYFEKNGYKSRTVKTDLYPGLMLSMDIVMIKEDQQ